MENIILNISEVKIFENIDAVFTSKAHNYGDSTKSRNDLSDAYIRLETITSIAYVPNLSLKYKANTNSDNMMFEQEDF